jgi:hypothetical protein
MLIVAVTTGSVYIEDRSRLVVSDSNIALLLLLPVHELN